MDITAPRGQVRVQMDDDCGEGIEGEYNPKDVKDIPLMRFCVERKYKGEWVCCEDSSYCTQIDARLPKQELKRLGRRNRARINQLYKPAYTAVSKTTDYGP